MPFSLKFVLSVALFLQHRRVDRLQDQIIARSSKVQQTEAIVLRLVVGREMDLFKINIGLAQVFATYSVYGGLDVVSSEETESVTAVDCKASV